LNNIPFDCLTRKHPVWCKHLACVFSGIELWLFEVAIGRNGNLQILGAKGGKCQFL